MSRLPRRVRKKTSAEVDVTKIAKLLRLLSSDKDGEVLATVSALKRALKAGGRDLHDLADIVQAGVKPAPQPPIQRSYGPSADNWESMCWYCWHHRYHLPIHQREFVEDMLLGRGDGFDEGRIRNWAIDDLRALAARVRSGAAVRWGAAAMTSIFRRSKDSRFVKINPTDLEAVAWAKARIAQLYRRSETPAGTIKS